MSIIYEPQGKAREYYELAVNLYKGCSYACMYCYVPLFTKQDRKTFHEKANARDDVIEEHIGTDTY